MPPIPKDSKPNQEHPLPLSATLADLAAIKAADMDLRSILPMPAEPEPEDVTLQASYEFVRNARAVLDIQKHGAVEAEGGKMEKIREELEDLLRALPTPPAT